MLFREHKRKLFVLAVLTEYLDIKVLYTLRANAEDGNQTISPNRKTTRISYVKIYPAAALVFNIENE